MKLARKLDMGRKPFLLVAVVASLSMTVDSLHGQDVLSANPEFWGRNASQRPEKAMQTKPAPVDRVSGYINAARDAEKNARTPAAKSLYEKALEIEPQNRIALLSFARMLHRTGDLDSSIAMYYRSLEHHRDDPIAMNDLALCYARKGELRRALAMLNGAISLKPKSVRYRNNIAKLLIELGRPSDAFAHLVDANGPVVGHYNMAKLLGQSGKTSEAIRYLEIATQMDPTFEAAVNLLAQARAQAEGRLPKPAGQVFKRLPAVEESSNPPSTNSEVAQSDIELPSNATAAIRTTPGGNATPALPMTPSLSDSDSNHKELANGPSMDTPAAQTRAVETRAVETTASRTPVGNDRTPWEPGSIRLQSAELVEELNAGEVDWAADFEELELSATSAPVPFDTQRRYTRDQEWADPIGRFLHGFE